MTNALSLETAVSLIDTEIAGHQQAIESLITLKKKVQSHKPELPAMKYGTMRKRDAIADVLRTSEQLLTYDEIWEKLVRGGSDCRGVRDIKTTVTMNDCFYSDGDRVGLKEWREHRAA